MNETHSYERAVVTAAQKASHFAARWVNMRSVELQDVLGACLNLYKQSLWHHVREALFSPVVQDSWDDFMNTFMEDLHRFCTPEEHYHVFDRLQAEGVFARVR